MFGETLRSAVASLGANKLRSALTVLGMTIGVASVIVLVAVGNGSSAAVQSSIQKLGTNVLLVMSTTGPSGPGAASADTGSGAKPLTTDDADAIQDPAQAPDVANASPVVSVAGATLVNGGTSYQPSQVVGTTPSYATAHDYEAAAGSMISQQDLSSRNRVAVRRPDRGVEPFRRTGPGRSDDPDQRLQLSDRRRDEGEGVERLPGPGRLRDRPR